MLSSNVKCWSKRTPQVITVRRPCMLTSTVRATGGRACVKILRVRSGIVGTVSVTISSVLVSTLLAPLLQRCLVIIIKLTSLNYLVT